MAGNWDCSRYLWPVEGFVNCPKGLLTLSLMEPVPSCFTKLDLAMISSSRDAMCSHSLLPASLDEILLWNSRYGLRDQKRVIILSLSIKRNKVAASTAAEPGC
ncbi:hypothetical protein PC116_g33767 [Phytophthora cactorum]|nr:hypothetical protein PC116_g33767 [Phytophthora cactorum]